MPAAGSAPLNPSLSDLQSARVLVVGDAMLDRYWFGAVERISPEAPVPVAKISRILSELSLDVATAEEARAMLALKGADRVAF